MPLPFFTAIGSRVFGDRPSTWEVTLTCLLHTSPCLPEDKRFDIMTLVCGSISGRVTWFYYVSN